MPSLERRDPSSNNAFDPPIRVVTVRACARPAPPRLAGQRERWPGLRRRQHCVPSSS